MLSKQTPQGEGVIYFEINEGCQYWVFIIFNKIKKNIQPTHSHFRSYAKTKIGQKSPMPMPAIELAHKMI